MLGNIRRAARSVRDSVKPEGRALSGKLGALLTGSSAVSRSCQIGGLREKYAELGLKPGAGLFVEVGAFDGEDFSNTSFLADQGWRGLYVEPVPKFAALARRRHALNKVTVEQVAVTNEPGEMTIHVMGALTTGDLANVEALKSVDWARDHAEHCEAITVRTDTLEALLTRNAVPHDFDLMVVDIEGAEKPVIDQLLASPWRPSVLIVELVDHHPNFTGMPQVCEDHREIRRVMAAAGYGEFYVDEINSVFRRVLAS